MPLLRFEARPARDGLGLAKNQSPGLMPSKARLSVNSGLSSAGLNTGWASQAGGLRARPSTTLEVSSTSIPDKGWVLMISQCHNGTTPYD